MNANLSKAGAVEQKSELSVGRLPPVASSPLSDLRLQVNHREKEESTTCESAGSAQNYSSIPQKFGQLLSAAASTKDKEEIERI
jgi:hypothetical protein